MSAPYILATAILDKTFACFRECGCGRRECQVLWISAWRALNTITHAVHPRHRSRGGGFVLETNWLDEFWQELAETGMGIRVQVHTHPRTAFHSLTDDAYPIIHTPRILVPCHTGFRTRACRFQSGFSY